MTKDNILLLLFTFITVLAWIGFDVYHVRIAPALPKVTEDLILPISPDIDQTTLEGLRSRR
ncbi:hypothetical protein COY33_01475 [candidate division WWE3 bacterium CG_4_10_14_0_2_um_filter_42_7]|uniref:Uncharacterized protein n=2 Tax=Katanobacteria TaxID=422282 RepID=A0A2H0X9Z1_UNCKA|nr:MAG: hypothetical protein COT51_00985 [candidate division WWE3 bacterium CG08_land_8_20_14_0_20_41_15]PIZ43444.1 MAG: hypothetical protein COY33_01475 [candidate division WWE3 bacterium CG_4_10_14_0_2_um_filter_42_7]